jgi:predicted nucleic acid-binding protein
MGTRSRVSVFVDTNIVLYASGVDEDRKKREQARALLNEQPCVLSVQVFNEFIHQATHPKRPRRMSMAEAIGIAHALTRFPVVSLDVALFRLAAEVQRKRPSSWWDSLIIAAAISAGCETLATEDMQHGRVIEGVRIENPFRELA